MGAIHFSLDVELVRALRRRLPLTHLVETGTFRGDTAERAAALFASVHTIELSAELHARARQRLAAYANLEAHHGDSAAVLQALVPQLRGHSVLYWLDAHWCGGATAGASLECPVLAELAAIEVLDGQSVVLIDDARLFLAPPPAPHVASAWPRLLDVTDALRRLSPQYLLWIVNDVIIFAPPACEADVVEYARACGVDLHRLWQSARAQ